MNNSERAVGTRIPAYIPQRILLWFITFLLATGSVSAGVPDPADALDLDAIRPRGKFRDSLVPDTLDLAQHAAWSVNALTGNVNPEKFYAVRFLKYSAEKFECEEGGNWDILPKNIRVLPYLRVMCGSSQDLDVELAMMRAMLEQVREDGQIYYPADGFHHPKNTSLPWFNGIAVLAMMNWYERDQNPAWKDWISLVCQGLKDVVVRVEDRAYYPPESSRNPDGTWNWTLRHEPMFPYNHPDEFDFDQQGYEGSAKFEQSYSFRALVLNYLLQGDRESLDTARSVANFVLKPSMWEDTSAEGYPGHEHGIWAGHVHGNIASHHALLNLAIAEKNNWLKQFVREAYDHTVRNGVVRMGWMPSWTLPWKYRRGAGTHTTDEPCNLGDWVVQAVNLSDAGLGDYWDDVDAIVRNHLTTHQIVDLEEMRRIAGGGNEHDDVMKRFVGSFNQGYKTWTWPVCGSCCTANGAFGFYYAWHGITRFDKGVATVNLFLNRSSEWMDIDSYLPYEGKVVLHNKKSHTAMVRIPVWVQKDKVRSFINDKPAQPADTGRSLVFSNLKKKDTIRLEFPVEEDVDIYHFMAEYEEGKEMTPVKYTLTFRGSTVVDIEPRDGPADGYRLYQRDHFKADKAPMKRVKRFVPETILPLQ
jgi:hypothetical protein